MSRTIGAIDFDLTTADTVAWTMEVHRRSKVLGDQRRNTAIMFGVLGGLLAVAAVVGVLTDGWSVPAVVSGLMGAFLASVGYQATQLEATAKAVVKLYDEWPGDQVGWHRVTLTTDGVIEDSAGGRNSSRWTVVGDVYETATHVFLPTSRTAAHIVPKRAFADAHAAAAFADTARRLIRAQVGPTD